MADPAPQAPSLNKQTARVVEGLALLLVLALALVLRLWQLGSFPPGLHYDEAIDLWAGQRILSGDLFIYLQQGWGREALYYYPLALMLALVENNVLALRLTGVVTSLVMIASAYVLVRHQTTSVVAWFTAAWMAAVFWLLFHSRSGQRVIFFPVMLNLAVLAFWWAFSGRAGKERRRYVGYLAAGLLLGLTLYTYQPSRFAPFLFLGFMAYLGLCHRRRFKEEASGFQAWLIGFVLVASPLLWVLVTNQGLEGDRFWTVEPLVQLVDGNPGPIWHNLIATAKMFTFSGDPLVTYNVPGRPIFVPQWTGIFFYAGLALAMWRWRRPFYAFVLIWLLVMLMPTVVTISAPNYPRTIGALTPVAILAGLPMGELATWITHKWRREAVILPLAIGVLAIVLATLATWQAYFVSWPAAKPDAWQRNYNVALNDVASYLQNDPDKRAVAISSRNIEDAHPLILSATLERDDLEVRWVDTSMALVLPAGQDEVRLLVTRDRWIDSGLSDFTGIGMQPAQYHETFTLIEARFDDWGAEDQQSIGLLPAGSPLVPAETISLPVRLPVAFEGKVLLESVLQFPQTVSSGKAVTFFTSWQVLQSDRGRPLKLFVHLLDDQGKLVAQEDGLGYPLHSWQPGDRFIHVHHLSLDGDLEPGDYWLQLGLYEGSSGKRWQIQTGSDQTGDRLLLGSIIIQPD